MKPNVTINERYCFSVTSVILLIMVIIKLLYIFYMTRRGNEHGFPFDTYLFNTPDRFTDYIITKIWSAETNPWDPNHPLLQKLISAPYGPVSFDYIRASNFLSSIGQFFILIILYLFANFKLFNTYLGKSINVDNLLIFFALIVGFFPLHFMVDRGNIEILPAALFSLLFLTPFLKFKYIDLIFCVLIILIIGSKFSLIPLIAIIIFFPLKRAFFVAISVALIYLYPIIFDGASLNGYVSTIINSYNTSGKSLNWTHNIFHALQMVGEIFGKPFSDRYVFLTFIFGLPMLIIPFLVLLKKRYINRIYSLNDTFFLLSHIIIWTIIFSNPSFDYRLIYLLPIYLFLINLIIANKVFTNFYIYIFAIIPFCLSVSWLNFYLKSSGYSWYMPIRSFSILIIDMLIVYLIFYFRNLDLSRAINE